VSRTNIYWIVGDVSMQFWFDKVEIMLTIYKITIKTKQNEINRFKPKCWWTNNKALIMENTDEFGFQTYYLKWTIKQLRTLGL
jgi:hypothetical protein